ncbi:MAG: adenylate/guanylate cyclase domain-containing protein [Acidimicrobiia bacterium]
MHKVLRRFLYAVAIAALAAALTAGGLSAGIFGGFQRRASDALFPSAKTDDRIVVVGIDGTTIREVGQVPLPRSAQALLARQLTAAGASVVVWDVLFSGEKEGDAELEAALQEVRAPIIGASYIAEPSDTDPTFLEVKKVDLAPLDRLAQAGNTEVAHVNVINDPSDGVVRSLTLVYEDGAQFRYGLAVQALAALRHTEPIVRSNGDIQVGQTVIPTEGRRQLRLNFAPGLDRRDDKAIISAADVLTGAADPARFRNKVVFIGATTPVLGDTKLVPVDKSNTFPGVLIHANALNTMLTASYLETVSPTETTVWVALVTLLAALSVLFLPLWLAALANFVIGFGYLLITFVRFDDGHVMNVVYTTLGQFLAFLTALGVKYVTETRQRRRVSSLFAQYVPEEVARQLELSGALESHIEGERVDVGLFFCDLRGFTSLSATLEPNEVRAMLNHFYDLLTEIIHSHGGTVLKFVGDEVFAVFGAPLPCDNNAQSTLDCAMEIQGRAHELDTELANLHIPPVKFGIGMNAGDVVAAHIGGGRRRQYDIVGDTVNLGSRLCSQAGKSEIVLPEKMIERLTNVPPMESMGAVQLKGLDEPVPLFKVLVGESEPRQATPTTTGVPTSAS